MKPLIFNIACIFLFLAFFDATSYPAEESGYIKAECVIHVHTTISSGYLTIEDYARIAKEKGVDAVVITDNVLRRYEYGLWPFRRILKKVVERDSILKYGPRRYLESIEETNNKYKDVVIIDGAQVDPFYFWSGSVFKGNLTLNNRNKDLLIIGLGDADGYKNLPLVGNRRSRFDLYHGEKYTEPYQDLIDYTKQRGALAFWSHPEIEENLSISGVRLITVPYPYELLATVDYAGFGIFAEGYNTIGKPLGLWDRVLTEYCHGKRKSPIWAIGELEYGGEENRELTDTLNVLYVKNISREYILDAFKKGRFYVITGESDKMSLTLDEFILSEREGKKFAMLGDTLVSNESPFVKIKLSHKKSENGQINVKLIKNNQIVKEFSGSGSINLEFSDENFKQNGSAYYRIDVVSQDTSHIISNPIFFKRIEAR